VCSQALCFFPLVNYLAHGLDIECCCLKQNAYRLLDYVSGESTQEIKKAILQQIEIGPSNRELCRHGPRNYPTETKIGRENKALLRGTMNKEEGKAQVNLFYLPLSIKSRWMRRKRGFYTMWPLVLTRVSVWTSTAFLPTFSLWSGAKPIKFIST
jgi:hypothetical protein